MTVAVDVAVTVAVALAVTVAVAVAVTVAVAVAVVKAPETIVGVSGMGGICLWRLFEAQQLGSHLFHT